MSYCWDKTCLKNGLIRYERGTGKGTRLFVIYSDIGDCHIPMVLDCATGTHYIINTVEDLNDAQELCEKTRLQDLVGTPDTFGEGPSGTCLS